MIQNKYDNSTLQAGDSANVCGHRSLRRRHLGPRVSLLLHSPPLSSHCPTFAASLDIVIGRLY